MLADKLKELGISIPEGHPPQAKYVPAVRTGNLVFVAGHGPRREDGSFVQGKLGRDLSVDDGMEAARLAALQCLGALQREIGSLDNVVRIVKVLGMVNCTEDFEQQPQVINGASELLVDIFGARGEHARSAVGMQSLPSRIAVEVEMVVEVR